MLFRSPRRGSFLRSDSPSCSRRFRSVFARRMKPAIAGVTDGERRSRRGMSTRLTGQRSARWPFSPRCSRLPIMPADFHNY